jgi:hypothetical protein
MSENTIRHGNAATCGACGEQMAPKRGSRRQRYCSTRCRADAHRGRKNSISGHSGRALRSVQNRPVNSIACKGDFACRGYGIEGPRDVIAQVFAGRAWDEIISEDGVRSLVSDLPRRMLVEQTRPRKTPPLGPRQLWRIRRGQVPSPSVK